MNRNVPASLISFVPAIRAENGVPSVSIETPTGGLEISVEAIRQISEGDEAVNVATGRLERAATFGEVGIYVEAERGAYTYLVTVPVADLLAVVPEPTDPDDILEPLAEDALASVRDALASVAVASSRDLPKGAFSVSVGGARKGVLKAEFGGATASYIRARSTEEDETLATGLKIDALDRIAILAAYPELIAYARAAFEAGAFRRVATAGSEDRAVLLYSGAEDISLIYGVTAEKPSTLEIRVGANNGAFGLSSFFDFPEGAALFPATDEDAGSKGYDTFTPIAGSKGTVELRDENGDTVVILDIFKVAKLYLDPTTSFYAVPENDGLARIGSDAYVEETPGLVSVIISDTSVLTDEYYRGVFSFAAFREQAERIEGFREVVGAVRFATA